MLVLDVVGESSNTDEKKTVEAIAYGLGKSVSNDFPTYVKPQMVERLPDTVLPPKQGPLEATEEVSG
jgi:hypothetical protein